MKISFRSPYALVVITLIPGSFGALLARLISIQSPYLLLTFSFIFTALTLGVYFYFQTKKSSAKLLANFRWQYCFWGLFGYFAYLIPYNESFRAFGSASEATILNHTWPILTVIFSKLLFRSNKTRKSFSVGIIESLALGLGFISVMLVATEGVITNLNIVNPPGLAWGLFAGVAYGLFSAYSATIPEDRMSTFLLTGILTSLVLIMPLGIAEWNTLHLPSLKEFGFSFLLGGLVNGIGYVSWTLALSRAKEQGIAIVKIISLIFLLPLLSQIVIAIFLGETSLFQVYFFISLALTTCGSILAQRAEQIANRLKLN